MTQNDDQNEELDPFDPERLRNAALENIGVEKVLLTVPVRKPARTEFFRVYSDPGYTIDWFILERDGEMGRETFWVTEKFRGELLDELKPVRIFTCINKRGVVFLWPAKLPSSSAIGQRWHESGLEIAERAKTSWVRMRANKDLGAYELFQAKGDLGEPTWPDKTLRELLALAFKGDRLINSLDHPVLRELAGEM